MTTTFSLGGRGGTSFNFRRPMRDPAFERPEHAMEVDGGCLCGECLAIDAEEAEQVTRERFADGTYNDRSNEG